jgi:hypothetical protein
LKFRIPKQKFSKYIVPADNNRKKLSIRYKVLTEQQVKAVSATIPFIPDIYECEIESCHVTDIMSTVLLFACFMNPSIKRFALIRNPVRTNFKLSLLMLVNLDPNKFTEINIAYSIQQVEQMETMSKAFKTSLIKLNLEAIPLGMNATRVMSRWLLEINNLKDLNLMKCGLAGQSARYVIDAIARNLTIRHLNLSYNNFESSIFEFGVKVAATFTRHPTLLHA